MSKSDVIGIIAMVLFVFGIITLLVCVDKSSDVSNFEPYPDNSNCIIVEWETNRLFGPDEDKSGIFCRETL